MGYVRRSLNFTSQRRSSSARRQRRERAWRLEHLERRITPAQFTVNVFDDLSDLTPKGDGVVDVDLTQVGNQISLRGALEEAQSQTRATEITLPAGEFRLTRTLLISGGGGTIAVAGAGTNTIIDADGTDRVFTILGSSQNVAAPAVFLSDLTVRGGAAVEGNGGGIRNDGLLTLTDVWVTGNSADGAGGGIANSGIISLIRSTVSGNQAGSSGGSGRGGGIFHSSGFLTLVNSTVSSNVAVGAQLSRGGGIFVEAGLASLQFSTITENTALSGGGIDASQIAPVQLLHTIVANNFANSVSGAADPDLTGFATSLGFNLIGNVGSANFTSATTDLVGGGEAGTLDPQLNALDTVSGLIPVHIPAITSPAVDAGSLQPSEATDQRQGTRPLDGDGDGVRRADIGAVELVTEQDLVGRVFDDRTADGLTADDPLLSGVTVNLFRDSSGGELTADDVLVSAQVTSQGVFTFDDLPAGQYFIALAAAPNQVQTAGGNFDRSYYTLILPADGQADDLDFAVFRQPRVTGRTQEDLEGDGTGDEILGNVELRFFRDDDGDGDFSPNNDELVTTVNTGAAGTYDVSFPLAGRFFVVPTVPAGASLTSAPADAPYAVVDLIGGQFREQVDLAFFFLSEVTGTIFFDPDGDGFSANDPARAGQSVSLFLDDGDGIFSRQSDDRLATEVSDAQGEFSFNGLRAGTYFVALNLADIQIQTAGGNTTEGHYRLEILSGTQAVANFAVTELGTIRGTIFDDVNGNGIQDANEAGLRNWAVVVSNPATGIAITVQTNAAGVYERTGLRPGVYEVRPEIRSAFLPANAQASVADWSFLETNSVLADLVVADVSGDVSGDAIPEILLLHEYPASLWVAHAENGAFLEDIDEIPLPANSRPRAMQLSDLDRDGDLDVVIASVGRPELLPASDVNRLNGAIYILTNGGQGQFSLSQTIPVTGGAYDVLARDLNGDGRADLATIGLRSATASVWYQTASGAFSDLVTFATAGTPVSLSAVDLNDDSLLDLTIASATTRELQTWLGQVDGSFSLIASRATTESPLDIQWADLNGNGRPDLVSTNFPQGRLNVWADATIVNGQLSFASTRELDAGDSGAVSFQVADMNGDQLPDLLVANSLSSRVTTLYNLGQLEFSAPFRSAAAPANDDRFDEPRRVWAAELNDSPGLEVISTNVREFAVVMWSELPSIDVEVEFATVADQRNFGMVPISGEPTPVIQSAAASEVSSAASDVTPDGEPEEQTTTLPIALDVNADGHVSPLDALLVINYLSSVGTVMQAASEASDAAFKRLDTSGDGHVSPLDALLVINHLNQLAVVSAAPPAAPPSALPSAAVPAGAPAASAPGSSSSVVVDTESSTVAAPSHGKWSAQSLAVLDWLFQEDFSRQRAVMRSDSSEHCVME